MGFALFCNDRQTGGRTGVTKLLTTFGNYRAKFSDEKQINHASNSHVYSEKS